MCTFDFSCRKRLQQRPDPPWIVIENVHVPVHQIDVNVTNPVVEKRDTRGDRGVLAAVQTGTAVVVIADTTTVTDTLIEGLTVAEIVIGESCVHTSIYCLTSHHSSSRRTETRSEEQSSKCKENFNLHDTKSL